MGLFKKKELREIREDDSTLTKLWLNPRTHALIVLGGYLIFFIIIIIIAKTSQKPENSNTVSGSSLNESFAKLDNYSFNYIIKGNSNYLFNGTKENDSITGSLSYNGKVLNIVIENNVCKVRELDERTNEYIDSDELCPEGLNYNFFDPSNIYKVINSLNGTKSYDNKQLSFKIKEDTEIKIIKDKEEIDKILIKSNLTEYELEYNEVDIQSNEQIENNI